MGEKDAGVQIHRAVGSNKDGGGVEDDDVTGGARFPGEDGVENGRVGPGVSTLQHGDGSAFETEVFGVIELRVMHPSRTSAMRLGPLIDNSSMPCVCAASMKPWTTKAWTRAQQKHRLCNQIDAISGVYAHDLRLRAGRD